MEVKEAYKRRTRCDLISYVANESEVMVLTKLLIQPVAQCLAEQLAHRGSPGQAIIK